MNDEIYDELEEIPVWGDGNTIYDVNDYIDFEWED